MACESIGIECTVNLPARSDGLCLLECDGDVGTGFEMTDCLAQDPVGLDQGLTNFPVRLPELADVGNDLIADTRPLREFTLSPERSSRSHRLGGPAPVVEAGGPQVGGEGDADAPPSGG
jgi:hypothetical protein